MAVVHEWIQSRAGSEKTFEQLAQALPGSDLFALTHAKGVELDVDGPIATTMLQRSTWLAEHRSAALPLMPLAWNRVTKRSYDLVLTSSHAFSRYFPIGDAVHLSYVHSPLRYAWLPDVDGRGSGRLLSGPRAVLRKIDRRTVDRVTEFAANSRVVAQRIEDFYSREAVVIPPPVDTDYFHRVEAPPVVDVSEFVLGMSRWIPYKRLDLVIRTADRLGMPCVIAGSGPDADRLAAVADEVSVPVTFVHSPTDAELRALYTQASLVVFPAEEDFGIVPVEAQACGTPVVALGRGGTLDSIVDGTTGVFAETQTVDDFAAAALRARELTTTIEEFRAHTDQFSTASFRSNIRAWVTRHVPETL